MMDIFIIEYSLSPWDKFLQLLLPVQTKFEKLLVLEVCLLPLKTVYSSLPSQHPFLSPGFN
jgi:hypothetical protein